MTTSPRAEGPMAAMAGRSIPGSDFSTILPRASSAPVLPAETTPAASPAATASIARRIEDWRMRTAAVGFMSLEIVSGAWRMVQAALARRCFASCGPRAASSPTSRKRAFGVALGGEFQPVENHAGRVIAAHGVDRQREGFGHCQRCAMQTEVTRGVTSGADGVLQRLASRNHLAAIVVAAMAADVMGTLQLAAVAALGVGFLRQRLMAAAHAAA